MKYALILNLILIFSCATKSKKELELANNLMFVIGSVQEDSQDFIDAEKVRECVAYESKKRLSSDKYISLTSELDKHANEVNEYLETKGSDNVVGSYPKMSEDLAHILSGLVPMVENCEKTVGTTVEF